MNLNELLSARGPLGVASTAVGVGLDKIGVGVATAETVGPGCDVAPEPAHALAQKAPASSMARVRILREV